MSSPTNPLLDEINGLSPGAKAALMQAHGSTIPPGQPVGPEPPPLTMPAPSQTPSVPTMGGSPTISAPRGTVEGDQAARTKALTAGPGINHIAAKIENTGFGQRHPILGKIAGVGLQGLANIGDIAAESASPIARMALSHVPGTYANQYMNLKRLNSNIEQEQGEREKEAQTEAQSASAAHTEAETGNIPQANQHQIDQLNAQLAEHGLQMDEKGQIAPVAKENMAPEIAAKLQGDWKPVSGAQGANGEPLEYNETTGQYRAAPGVEGAQAHADKTETPEVQAFNALIAGGMTPAQAYEKVREKPVNVNPTSSDAAIDREGTRFGKPYETGAAQADAQLEKIADARSMINSSAAAQALGIPKILTALVSGQGSGVRITQAELNMIAHARGIQGDFEGAINKISGKGVLSKDQQAQFTSILDDVKKRIEAKQQIANATLDKINEAGSRDEIVQADKQARQQFSDLEKYGHYSGETVKVGGKDVVIKKINPDGTFDY